MKNKLLFLLCSVVLAGNVPCAYAEMDPRTSAIVAWGVQAMASAAVTGITHQVLKTANAKNYSAISVAVGVSSVMTHAMIAFGAQKLRNYLITGDGAKKDHAGDVTAALNGITNILTHIALYKTSPDGDRIGRSAVCGALGSTIGNALIFIEHSSV